MQIVKTNPYQGMFIWGTSLKFLYSKMNTNLTVKHTLSPNTWKSTNINLNRFHTNLDKVTEAIQSGYCWPRRAKFLSLKKLHTQNHQRRQVHIFLKNYHMDVIYNYCYYSDGTLIYERVPDKQICVSVNSISPSSHLKRRGYEELNGIDGK